MTKRVPLNCTITEETRRILDSLVIDGKSLGRVIDDLAEKSVYDGKEPTLAQIAEYCIQTLELVQSFPQDVENAVEGTMRTLAQELREKRSQELSSGSDPSSIPGVQRGASNLKPRRETGTERALREGQERKDRVAALDSSAGDREDIDRSDEFVSI